MEVIHLGAEHSLLNRFVMEMRDVTIQNDRLRFRRNIERVGEVMAYEISKKMTQQVRTVTTPLGEAECSVPQDKVVLATILRAGLPFHHGFLNYFDYCENAFVSAYRKYKDRLNFDIHIEYIAVRNEEGQFKGILEMVQGSSMELAYKALLTKGNPKHIHIASIIASQQAVDYIRGVMPDNTTIWIAAIDPTIDEHSYIVPGLGDAGDLAYGEKL